jgi:hypothetical protein
MGRGVALVVVTFVVGVILLNVGSRPPVDSAAGTSVPTTTVPAGTSTSTTTTKPPTTTTTVPRSSVHVLVANGTSLPNKATVYSDYLSAQGWNTLPPVDTTPGAPTVTASTVYYAAGNQAPADSIATELGLATSAVKPLTTSVPVSSTTGADVVVVVGPDLASKSPPTSA